MAIFRYEFLWDIGEINSYYKYSMPDVTTYLPKEGLRELLDLM